MGRPRALLGARTLPVLPRTQVEREDLVQLIEVQRVGKAALQQLSRGGAAGDLVAGEVIALVERIYELAVRLGEGKRFLRDTDTATLNRQLTELELEQMGAGAETLRNLKTAEASLKRRLALVAKVEANVTAMKGRLVAAVEELKELHAKLAAHLGNDLLVTEFQEAQQRTSAAIRAYVETEEEMAGF